MKKLLKKFNNYLITVLYNIYMKVKANSCIILLVSCFLGILLSLLFNISLLNDRMVEIREINDIQISKIDELREKLEDLELIEAEHEN